jgi:D-arabinitol dehydrogenase (NADP+)
MTMARQGEFISKFPDISANMYDSHQKPPQIIKLIPGHEAIGSIVEIGKNVKGFSIGDWCVADVSIAVSFDSPHHHS